MTSQKFRSHSVFSISKLIKTPTQVVEHANELSLVTNGERCYGILLFEICQEVVSAGQVGGLPTTLKKEVKVRVNNKLLTRSYYPLVVSLAAIAE